MNKKGTLGIETVKLTLLSLLVIALLIIAGMVVVSYLSTTVETLDVRTGSNNNESVSRASIVDGTGATLAGDANKRNIICSAITGIYNGTGSATIPTSNFTQSTSGSTTNCLVTNASTQVANGATNFLISYSFTYDDPSSYNILSNFSKGGVTFVSYVPTFFILLAVVVIILIITIVIVTISRFGAGSSISVSSGAFAGRGSFEE